MQKSLEFMGRGRQNKGEKGDARRISRKSGERRKQPPKPNHLPKSRRRP